MISIASGPTAERVGLPQRLRACRSGGRRSASLSFACRNQAQSESVACQRGDAVAGAVPTKSDTAARIPFEVMISSAESPRILPRLVPTSWRCGSPSIARKPALSILASPLSTGLSVHGCVLRSEAMLGTACPKWQAPTYSSAGLLRQTRCSSRVNAPLTSGEPRENP